MLRMQLLKVRQVFAESINKGTNKTNSLFKTDHGFHIRGLSFSDCSLPILLDINNEWIMCLFMLLFTYFIYFPMCVSNW